MKSKIRLLLTSVIVTLIAQACSTTSRLAKDEVLYTGVKKIKIESPEDVKVPGGLSSQVRQAVNVKPNNSLYSPYYRYPFPVGLWVWNHWDEPGKGIGKWLYGKLVEQPVLISDVRPELRTKMIDEVLENNGFFL